MKSYSYYANHVYEQAELDPTVNEQNSEEVIEYAEEIAELLVIDEDALTEKVRDMERTRTMAKF